MTEVHIYLYSPHSLVSTENNKSTELHQWNLTETKNCTCWGSLLQNIKLFTHIYNDIDVAFWDEI